jgi:hypothetical protein
MGGQYYSPGNVVVQISGTTSLMCNVNSVAANSSETLLVPANASRKGVIIYNQSLFKLNIKFGNGVTNESFTALLLPSSTYEMPTTVFVGDIYGIWEDAQGNAQITELI